MNTLERIKQQGNLFQLLMDQNTPVKLIRVYGYESKVGNTWLNFQSSREIDPEFDGKDMKPFIEVLLNLRESMAKETSWNDNKIVMEVEVGSHRIFIGYWDEYVSVGSSVIPNMYPPKYRMGQFCGIEMIALR